MPEINNIEDRISNITERIETFFASKDLGYKEEILLLLDEIITNSYDEFFARGLRFRMRTIQLLRSEQSADEQSESEPVQLDDRCMNLKRMLEDLFGSDLGKFHKEDLLRIIERVLQNARSPELVAEMRVGVSDVLSYIDDPDGTLRLHATNTGKKASSGDLPLDSIEAKLLLNELDFIAESHPDQVELTSDMLDPSKMDQLTNLISRINPYIIDSRLFDLIERCAHSFNSQPGSCQKLLLLQGPASEILIVEVIYSPDHEREFTYRIRRRSSLKNLIKIPSWIKAMIRMKKRMAEAEAAIAFLDKLDELDNNQSRIDGASENLPDFLSSKRMPPTGQRWPRWLRWLFRFLDREE